METDSDGVVKGKDLRGPLKRRGMAQDVADRIRAAILAGDIAPGERLNEVELATSLSVSRGPVRDAIVLLRQEGLLEGDWHKGSRVTVFTRRDLNEIYSLRFVMELLAIESLVVDRSGADLAILRQSAEEVERAAASGDPRAMVEADLAFHDAIYACARHERLANVWRGLRSQIALLLRTRQRGTDEYRSIIATEHWDLYRLIEEGDLTRAEEVVRSHLRGAFDRLEQAIDTDNPEV